MIRDTNASHDPRDIPVLTDEVGREGTGASLYDTKSVHAAVVTETLNLADSLLHQVAKDIEAALFERVFDELKAKLPELVDRVLREQLIMNTHAPRQEQD